MSFFKFSKFSKFFVCFVLCILFFGVQTRCMDDDSLNSSFATAHDENVDDAFNMFDNIAVPEVCEICNKNKPVYILFDNQIPDIPSSSMCVCCNNVECIQRYLEEFVLKYPEMEIMSRLYDAIPEIASKFKEHEKFSSFYRVNECLNEKCGKWCVSDNSILCPKCGSNCMSCFLVRSINDEDNIKSYRLFKFLFKKLDDVLENKIFLFGKSPANPVFNNAFIAKLLAMVMNGYTYQQLKRIYQILAIGRLEGYQIIKNQVVGGTLKKYVLIIKYDSDDDKNIDFCKKSNFAKKFSELLKEGYNVLYAGNSAVIDSYLLSALKEAGLLNNSIIDLLK